jgi:hypothetical protein
MNRYKNIYRIVQSIFILVTIALLAFILLPIWLYGEKEQSDISCSPVGNEMLTKGGSWITDYFKLNRSDEADGDILFFLDAGALNAGSENRLMGKAAVFEMLFSQETMNADAKKRIEYLTGATYSGFWGKTFEDLGDRQIVPARLISRYEENAGTKWNFRGEGIILTDGNKTIVLRQGKDYKGRMSFQSGGDEMPYYGYFEITSGPGPYAGQFSLRLNGEGEKEFSKYGLPSEFPAIYELRHNQYDGYYFAGDFSQLNIKEPYAYETMPWVLGHKGLYERYNNEEVYWKAYFPLLRDLITDLESRKQSGLPLIAKKEAAKSPFLADSEKFYITDGKEKEAFFIKGVDLGAALPGRTFTEFPQDKAIYAKWLSQMAELHVNTVRIYTLLPPEFYQALYEFNTANQSEPIYLLQEIWPEEKPEGNNYLGEEYNKTYRKEIEYAVQAVHGDIMIPECPYRSWGLYAYDVSPYLIGYLVGRELEPDEVLGTDKLNEGYHYKGDYIYSESSATPTESWLAQSCDYALSLEDLLYNNKPLAAIVSWPTLDPLEHDSEWNPAGNKALQYNDKAVVNIEHIGMNPEKASGFFGAYHIYPNYPDFMNNDVAYNSYQDEQGRFRYGGYLEAFIKQHKKFPALVAEYGISTSTATAHFSPDGYDHGGLSETEQANGIIRMTDAIVREGYAGAVIFEWMDEWTKKTWTTEYYMIPYNRHMLWHNVIDPEQNYGLLAHQAAAPAMKTVYVRTQEGEPLKRAAIGQDAAYLNIELTFENENAFTSPVSIALSTYELPGEPKPLWEFNILISPEPAVLVNPGYNWLNGRYVSVNAQLGKFEEMIQMINPENRAKDGTYTPAKYLNLSRLPGLITVEDQKAWIKLPYGLIGFSDPSSRKALYDPDKFIPSGLDQIGLIDAATIRMRVESGGKESPEITYSTVSWDEPDYIERQKDGFKILAEYFKKMN